MSFSALPITTIFNVSAATPQPGATEYNTANIAIFTRDTPGPTFPSSLGYQIYMSATQVATDWGSHSDTNAMAVAIFSQQPNILNNGGYLIVIPFLTATQVGIQTVTFPATPASGTFELTYGSNSTSALEHDTTATEVQTALQLVSGLSSVTVSGSIADGFTITFTGVSGNPTEVTISANSLEDANSNSVIPFVTVTQMGSSAETIDAAILRTQGVVQYFGIMSAEITPQTEMLRAAALVQTLNAISYFTSYTTVDIAPGGLLDLLRSGSFTQSRALPYFETQSSNQPTTSLVYMGSYASLGQSVNFSGSDTTITMHLKTLSGNQADPSMNPTLYEQAQAAGADVYASVNGIPKVLCSEANDFYDNQFNLQWFVGAVQVAEFNYLATVNTKIPQTEGGMYGLKGAARVICEQAVTNQFLSPGTWTGEIPFGNQTDFLNNIAQRGYYIYSTPISQQTESQRSTRTAPLVQIAIKYSGAIQSGQALINVQS